MSELVTENKSTVVEAVNEVHQDFENLEDRIGVVENHETDIVNSITNIQNGLTDANNKVESQGETIRQNAELIGKAFLSKPRFTGNIDELLNQSDAGMYWCAVPEGASGTLPDEVIKWFYLNVYYAAEVVTQIMFTYGDCDVYIRMFVNYKWGNWVKMLKADMFSKKNLLVNPDFKINQRGKTEYSGSGYTVDRWFTFKSCSKLSVQDGYIRLSNDGSSSAYLKQYLEEEVPVGTKCIATALVRGGPGYLGLRNQTINDALKLELFSKL